MSERATASGAPFEPITRCVEQNLEGLHPSYFAAAMATGIVSIACQRLGLLAFVELLFWVNVPCYGVVWLAMVARAVFHRDAFLRDWTSHSRAPGFLTVVAGLILAGFVVTIAGVVLYCVACFAGALDVGLGAILFDNVVPIGRATLLVLGIGSAL